LNDIEFDNKPLAPDWATASLRCTVFFINLLRCLLVVAMRRPAGEGHVEAVEKVK